MSLALGRTVALVLSAVSFQETLSPPQGPSAPVPRENRVVDWKDGATVRVRVPVASPSHQLMTTVAFPEETIETAISGWAESDITAVEKRGLLFVRLTRKSEGQLNVIGGSGTHYLLYLTGVEETNPGAYDDYLRIRREEEPKGMLARRRERRPSGALELIQAMRLGLRPEGTRILRAARELAYESPILEVRLLWVYQTGTYSGYVYEVANRTRARQAVDASRFRSGATPLILTALRENILEPEKSTRLYAVAWKE